MENKLTSLGALPEPTDNNERINLFLLQMLRLHETKDPAIAHWVFVQFDFLNIKYSEDQVRRLFNGND